MEEEEGNGGGGVHFFFQGLLSCRLLASIASQRTQIYTKATSLLSLLSLSLFNVKRLWTEPVSGDILGTLRKFDDDDNDDKDEKSNTGPKKNTNESRTLTHKQQSSSDSLSRHNNGDGNNSNNRYIANSSHA